MESTSTTPPSFTTKCQKTENIIKRKANNDHDEDDLGNKAQETKIKRQALEPEPNTKNRERDLSPSQILRGNTLLSASKKLMSKIVAKHDYADDYLLRFRELSVLYEALRKGTTSDQEKEREKENKKENEKQNEKQEEKGNQKQKEEGKEQETQGLIEWADDLQEQLTKMKESIAKNEAEIQALHAEYRAIMKELHSLS